MSNVVVIWNKRPITIKTTPSKPLSEVRSEACTRFGLSNPTSYILKRGATKLDLALPFRLSSLAAGAKLDLVQTSSASVNPISIVLRTVDPVSQLSGTFAPSTSIWGILLKFEVDAKAAGNQAINITERCAPSGNQGQGRLLYVMPVVRVANRELASFAELKKTLGELGCGARELLMLRFVGTEMPYEDALMEIAGMSKELETITPASSDCNTPESDEKQEVEKQDVVMEDTPPAEQQQQQAAPSEAETAPTEAPQLEPEPEPEIAAPKIAVYQPSTSATPAAASFEVPDAAYEVGIAQLQRIKESYHTASLPQRLLSDKELAEKEAATRQEMEKINLLKIKVRYPDGYLSQQELDGKATARDLYNLVRATLRYPNEPFVLMIPPRDVIKDDACRLTLGLKLRSGASLHLAWAKEASDKAKSSPALNDELLKASKELPKPAAPKAEDYMEIDEEHKEKKKEEQPKDRKGDIEKKLKGLLRLGRK
ncbi:GLUT4 regulating protein TUG-domain-containing protein [Sphaerosporella brunnea]|uniref:GLUT4 regulating protein TUG-domain-containing protein n=1 Tax=Sphaerosporella brunnea TaxID=1250544 RepID=A0A5J5EX87_9PEZI|nr:GLUT4 regulating protein TUG-domain-containing protein [Sphaerosporella brunnea]